MPSVPVASAVPGTIVEAMKAVDAKDAARFASCFTANGVFRYANAPAVHGPHAIQQSVAQFFDAVRSLHHDVLATWVQGDMVFCKGDVAYVRHNGSPAGPFPFFNLFRMEGDKVAEWLIYVDISPLWS